MMTWKTPIQILMFKSDKQLCKVKNESIASEAVFDLQMHFYFVKFR